MWKEPFTCIFMNCHVLHFYLLDQSLSSLVHVCSMDYQCLQRAVLEPAMEGRDMIGRAITGSGKTLAFAIPILDKIIQHRSQDRFLFHLILCY